MVTELKEDHQHCAPINVEKSKLSSHKRTSDKHQLVIIRYEDAHTHTHTHTCTLSLLLQGLSSCKCINMIKVVGCHIAQLDKLEPRMQRL